MGLLAPLFLLGLAAIALPFWLHRLQTQSSERKPFSSAMLLETAKEQVHVRKKLKYLLLLAARVLLLALLALAFAKPFIEVPPETVAATADGTHLFVVDTSASMSRAGVASQVDAVLARAVDDAPAGAMLQLMAADSTVRVLGELSPDPAVLRAEASRLGARMLRLDYGEAMSAVERFAASVPPPVTVHFISDFQATGMPVRFSDLVAGGVSRFVPHVVGTGEPFNWSVDYLRETADGIQVGVTGSGDRERIADVELLVNGSVFDTQTPGSTGPLVLDYPLPAFEDGDNRVEVRINADDDLAADNRWYYVADHAPPAPVPLITADTGGLPYIYLSAALESAGEYRVEPLLVRDVDTRILGRYQWVAVDDIGLLDDALADGLTAYVRAGGNLLAFAGERSAGLETLPVTGNRQRPSAAAPAGAFLSVGQVDTSHPALAGTEGWQNVHVTRSLPIVPDDNDQVLVRLDNDDALLLERRIGQGRVMLVPMSLDSRWSDLAARPVFVGFVIEVARYLAGVNQIPKTYVAGASLPLGASGNTAGQVIDPDGNTVLSLADTTREQQIKLDKPGFYEVYTPQGETVVAANVDPRESDLRRIGQDVLDRWQGAFSDQAPQAASVAAEQSGGTVELWRWLLLALALIVIGESILGNIRLRPHRVERA